MISPELKPVFQRGFAMTSKALIRAKFNGLWVDGEIPKLERDKVFVFSTHSSWWDPVVFSYLAVDRLGYRTLAPMDADQFRNYKSLKHVGIFGVERGDGPEVEAFLRLELEKNPRTLIWVTPQGKFSPNELEQPSFKSGLSRWSNQLGALRLPVVVHYHLSDRSKPDIFVRFGEPIEPSLRGVDEDSEILRQALTRESRTLLERVWKSHSNAKFDHAAFRKA